jgi:hypothetical protein
MTFQPFLLIRKTVIVGRRVLLGEAIDVIARRGQPSQQILVPDLPEKHHPIGIHPLRWNRAQLSTVRIPPGLRSLEVHRHGNHHLGVVRWIETNLTLSHMQMSKRRHASMKKTSSTADMPDVPRLTRVTENGIGTTIHTLVTERYYVRPYWASGEGQSASQPACYVVYHRIAFLTPSFSSLETNSLRDRMELGSIEL